MKKDLNKKSSPDSIFDSLKNKLIDLGIDYAKKSFKLNTQEIAKNVEKYITKTIEARIKREVRRQTIKFSSYALIGLGLCFIVYFTLQLTVSLLELPAIFTNLLFGLFMILFGIILFSSR